MVERNREKSVVIGSPPEGRYARDAPPVPSAGDNTLDYCCGECGALLMHADDQEVHNLIIRCTDCKSFNSMDIWSSYLRFSEMSFQRS
jgi:DNA-directed RNA polymerase subunit RPC12/RpoP